ncbi:MAG: menaquinone biosynthesis protein [Ferruginibacter sp.]
MDSKKVKTGSVSYLNAKPLIYGFEKGMMNDEVDLVIDHPAAIARQLMEDEIDIGLVPVAIIPLLKEYYIVSDYCIGSDGEVASVCLFSDVPLAEIETILLDYQSKTSVALLKILLKQHWNISPVLIDATESYENNISGTTAGLVIGDRAFRQRLRSTYIYDLGLAWKAMTGLPFVYAAWVSNKKLTEKFKADFNKANEAGLDNIEAVIKEIDYDIFDLHAYYSKNISYRLDALKEEGLQLFLKYIGNGRY